MPEVDGPLSAVPNFQIDSGAMGGPDAFATFAASIADVFEVCPADSADLEEYRSEVAVWHLGTMMMGSFRSTPLTFQRSQALAREGRLDHVLIQLYVEGGFTGIAGDQPIVVREGDIVVFDLANTLSTVASAFWNVSVLVPRRSFQSAMDRVDLLHGLVLRRDMPIAGLLADYLLSLIRRLPNLSPDEAIVSANTTATLAMTVLAGQIPQEPVARTAPRSAFRSVAAYIDEHLHESDLNADQLAVRLGMSRASLYRLFEPVGGVASYIRRRRLTSAALMLAEPASSERRIGEVAFEHGFSSEATFSRAFRQAFGTSPKGARMRSAALLTAGSPAPDLLLGQDMFANWLRTLQA